MYFFLLKISGVLQVDILSIKVNKRVNKIPGLEV